MSHHHEDCHSCNQGRCEKHGHVCNESCARDGHTCQEDFAKVLQCVADEAWMEVLKAKIKHHIENHSGHHLNELAAIVAEANSERWKHKIGIKKSQQEFRDKLAAFFTSGSCCKGSNRSSGNQHKY